MMRRRIPVLTAVLLCTPAFDASARFLSVDPVQFDSDTGSNFNRYYYGNNNPYVYVDPDGRFALQLAGGIAGAVIGGGASYLKGNGFGTVARDAAIGAGVGMFSTIPGGGPIATGIRAGFASGAGDVLTQASDKGVANVDLSQSAKEAVIGGLVGGFAKRGADALVPNRGVPGLPESHPLVREGRALPQQGTEAAAAPVRNATEVAGGALIGGSVAGARALSTQPATASTPPPEEQTR